jgi:hypothetical protein
MAVLLRALERLGFRSEVVNLAGRWERFLKLSGSVMTPEYRRCFPEDLLSRIEQLAFEGFESLGCDTASPVMRGAGRQLLNEAWRVFWCSPNGYVEWERSAVLQLGNAMRGNILESRSPHAERPSRDEDASRIGTDV